MSGICGFLSSRYADGNALLETMASTLCNRPGESVSYHTSGRSGVACSDTGSTLMKQGLIASIQGRPEWPDPQLAGLAAREGAAAAVIASFQQFRRRFLERLRGSFSVALLDPANRYALLATDRMGVRPLAFLTQGDQLVFGSRLDALLAYPGVTAHVDPQSIFDYLYFHMVPSPGTIYRGIEKLLPGQMLEFDNGRSSRTFYWHAPYQEPDGRSNADLKEGLFRLLRGAVAKNLSPDPLGAFLSGGLDSSTVTGLLAEASPGPADAFGIGFSAKGYDEMGYARITAESFKVNLHEYYVTPDDVTNSISLIAKAYDEPFGNASALPAYYCARLARQAGKTVLLAGDGGDEIFAGNARYAKQKLFEFYNRLPEWSTRGLLNPLLLRPKAVDKIMPLRKVKSYIQQAMMPMPERLESYNFLHRTPLEQIFAPDFIESIDTSAPLENVREVYNRTDSDSLVKRMLHLDLKITLADNDLRKVNRMCELAGIEVRYPMLEQELVEFAARVPSELLLKRLRLRYFYKQAMRGFLPAETLGKNKQGFGLPFGVWMTNHQPLQALAYDSLASFKKRGILLPAYLDRLVDQHDNGHAGYYGVMIWVLMMLEQWLQAHGH